MNPSLPLPYRGHATTSPDHGAVQGIAVLFSMLLIVKVCFGEVFFQSNPAMSAVLVGALLGGFLTLLVAFRVSRPSVYLLPSASSARWTWFLLAWFGVSVFWTNAESGFNAGAYWCEIAAGCFCMLLLLGCAESGLVVRATLDGFVYGALVTAAASFAFAGITNEGRLGDDQLLHPNTIGNLFGLAAVIALYLWQTRPRDERIKWFICFLLILCSLIRSTSKTSIIGFALAFLIFLTRSAIPRRRKMAIILACVLPVAAGSVALASYLEDYVYYQAGGNAVDTLSGRTILWSETWSMVLDKPVLGYGYNSFRDVGPTIEQVRVPHAHDEWLTLWFNGGIIAVVLTALVYLSFLRQVRRLPKGLRTEGTLCLCILIYGLVQGITSAGVYDLVLPMPLLILLSYWMECLRRGDEVLAMPVSEPRLEASRVRTFGNFPVPTGPAGD